MGENKVSYTGGMTEEIGRGKITEWSMSENDMGSLNSKV